MLFLFLLRFQLKQYDTARLQIPEYESWIEMASSLPGNYANTPSTAWSLARFNAVPELSVHHFWHSLSPSKVIESNQLATIVSSVKSILSRSSQETLEATYNSWQSIGHGTASSIKFNLLENYGSLLCQYFSELILGCMENILPTFQVKKPSTTIMLEKVPPDSKIWHSRKVSQQVELQMQQLRN